MTRELVLRLSISQNNVFNLTTDIKEMLDELPCWHNSVLQTLIGPPNFAGNDTSRKVSFLPPRFCSSDIRFPTALAHFGALTCTLRLRTRSRMCVGLSDTLNPFTGHRKGVSPVRNVR
ncbi:hypothetical protein TNIN_249461 [Trichonephila inaurata madagascariensis]|uniref:Uncharacterized protein n=1 Tax=Trichonephila inaurata madagascariensis TaxID=2747483 RepID=A0A8X6XK56_9ARAC|nr:hypothetical protein TNIN_249461 [Trichonephila inaurata madagascariensis]